MSAIHKKRSKGKCENYGGIAITSTVTRMFGKPSEINWNMNLQNMKQKNKMGRSTLDHIYCITYRKPYSSNRCTYLTLTYRKHSIGFPTISYDRHYIKRISEVVSYRQYKIYIKIHWPKLRLGIGKWHRPIKYIDVTFFKSAKYQN